MREIKFRMWNPYSNRFHHDPHTVLECLKQQVSNRLHYDHLADGSRFDQYTGLKDKNGVEIFEGDIIVYKNTIEEGKGVIDFSAGFIITWILSTVKTNSPSLISCLYYLQCPQELEVIGNIHQHPHLLTGDRLRIPERNESKRTSKLPR